jgi:hypothetical protein
MPAAYPEGWTPRTERLANREIAWLLVSTFWVDVLWIGAAFFAAVNMRDWNYLGIGAAVVLCDGAYWSTRPALRRFRENRIDDPLGSWTADGGTQSTPQQRRERIVENWRVAGGFAFLVLGTLIGNSLPLALTALAPFSH